MDIKSKIIDYVKKHPGTTYVELEHIFNECNFPWEGENVICSTMNEKVILWTGWSEAACNLLNQLQLENSIKKDISNVLCYVIDGKTLNLPIVKSAYDYKTEHWLPVEFTAV